MKKLIVFTLFVFTFSFSNAQLLDRMSIPVTNFGQELKFGMVGGLNSAQFSSVDLNNNGTLDLYIFDKTGNISLTFINNGTNGEPDYEYAPHHQKYFPEMTDWVLLRDYDDDGVVDIFTYSDLAQAGIRVFKGHYLNSHLVFNRFNFNDYEFNIIPAETTSGETNLYVSFVDYPAVDDIDGDGDLDIVTFASGGGHVYLYNNESMEMGFGKDSLIYTLEDDCWGQFYESGLSVVISLSPHPDSCSLGFAGEEVAEDRHAGSTLLTLDMDNDGDKELILGDLSFNNLNLLYNAGDNESAWMNVQDTFAPKNTLPADIPIFPASFYLDVDNDGKKDLLASPNSPQTGEDYDCVWFYKNTNSNETPVFQIVQKDFFVEHMVDMGTGAHPVFVDYNADGLLDLVVGNNSFFLPFGEKAPRIYLYENIGTATDPAFDLVDDDYLDFSQFDGSQNFAPAPTFGDMDNDGDLDLVVGERQGAMFYAENIAGSGNPLAFGPFQFDWMDIDLGQHATPQIVDLDRDGLPDLVVGERSGKLYYFHNEGTQSEPLFIPNIDFDSAYGENIIGLGGVDTRFVNTSGLPNFTGFAAPVILDFDGEYALFTGSEVGYILHHSNIDNNIDGLFTLETDHYGNERQGFMSHPAFADIDDDGVLEILIGNERGGFSIFKSTFTTDGSVSVNHIYKKPDIQLFPNPAKDAFKIEIENWNGARVKIDMYNAIGQLVYSDQRNASMIDINTNSLSNGIYFCEISVGFDVVVEKVVLNK